MMEKTLEQRMARVRELRVMGYNCAQAVVMAYNDIAGLSEDQCAVISAGLGGGVGGTHQTCGCVTGSAMVIGMANFSSPADKSKVYGCVSECCRKFAESNGSTICSELRAPGGCTKSCNQLIFESLALIDESLGME